MKIIGYNELNDSFFETLDYNVEKNVKNIINDVKQNGDSAINKYCRLFDKCSFDNFEVSEKEIEKAYSLVSEDKIKAMRKAIKNVRTFAKRQLNSLKKLDTKIYGCKLGHRIIPLESVGCYIPGGNYPLPSSAIMTIIPAKVAKVQRILAFSPKIKPETIVATHLSGADKIYKIGGVQAIAAAAYGTETIQKVNKIVGPGNKYVTAAKKEVFGVCGIDFLAGPSEVMIVADETANLEFVAADMLAQCEHDLDARAILLAFDDKIAKEVYKIAIDMLKILQTKEIAQKSFEKSLCIVCNNLEEAIDIANKKAPEHLELCIKDAKEKSVLFHNYGSLFIGNYSAEVFGDYTSGTNHTLPTNGVAKYSGGLSVFDYVKIQTYQMSSRLNARHLAKTASILAQTEGLWAHKLASDLRK